MAHGATSKGVVNGHTYRSDAAETRVQSTQVKGWTTDMKVSLAGVAGVDNLITEARSSRPV